MLPLVISPYCLLSFKTLHSHSFLEALCTSLASYSCFIVSWNIWAQHHFLNLHTNVSVGSLPSESFQEFGYVSCFLYTSLHAKRSQVYQAVALWVEGGPPGGVHRTQEDSGIQEVSGLPTPALFLSFFYFFALPPLVFKPFLSLFLSSCRTQLPGQWWYYEPYRPPS